MDKPDIRAVYEFFDLRIVGPDNRSWVKAQCPLPDHEDANPSATVNTDEGLWNCHACNQHGDAYDIIKEREGVTRWSDLKRRAAEITGGSNSPVSRQPARSSLLPGGARSERGRGTFVPAWRRL